MFPLSSAIAAITVMISEPFAFILTFSSSAQSSIFRGAAGRHHLMCCNHLSGYQTFCQKIRIGLFPSSRQLLIIHKIKNIAKGYNRRWHSGLIDWFMINMLFAILAESQTNFFTVTIHRNIFRRKRSHLIRNIHHRTAICNQFLVFLRRTLRTKHIIKRTSVAGTHP